MHKNNLLRKGLVVGIIVLFIGVGVYPAFAVEPISFTNITQDNEIESLEDVEPKEYLFQTIIDIANNPDVKDLFEQIEDGWINNNPISFDFDSRGVFRKLLFNKPSLVFSMLFTKPSMTHKYLNFAYNEGIEITNILGEEEVLEIVESVEITNPEFFVELNNTIMNHEELSNRISTLAEMNKDNDTICFILYLLLTPTAICCEIFSYLCELNPESIIWIIIFYPPFLTFSVIESILALLLLYFDCWIDPFP